MGRSSRKFRKSSEREFAVADTSIRWSSRPAVESRVQPVIPRGAKRKGRHSARSEASTPSFRAKRSAVAESTPTTVLSFLAERSARAVIPRGAKRSRGIHPDHQTVIPREAKPRRCHSARSEAQSRNPPRPQSCHSARSEAQSRNPPRPPNRHSARSEAQSRNPPSRRATRNSERRVSARRVVRMVFRIVGFRGRPAECMPRNGPGS
jgi:hypothetical protein